MYMLAQNHSPVRMIRKSIHVDGLQKLTVFFAYITTPRMIARTAIFSFNFLFYPLVQHRCNFQIVQFQHLHMTVTFDA